jgi:hypothetical protein
MPGTRSGPPLPPDSQIPKNKYVNIPDIKFDVVKDIAEFLCAKYDDGYIPFARSTKGGWEGWLQIELAMFLVNRYKQRLAAHPVAGVLNYQVKREELLWTASTVGDSTANRGLCDIVIEPVLNSVAPPPRLPQGWNIELKAAAYGGALVRDGFILDIAKVRKDRIPKEKDKQDKVGVFHSMCIAVFSSEDELKPNTNWIEPQKGSEVVNYIWLRQEHGKNDLGMMWYIEGESGILSTITPRL